MPTTKKAGGSITAPTKTGYTFTGYYDAASGGTKYYNANLTSAKKWDKASATTLYAQWTANTYEVVFNGNGHTSGSMPNQSFTYDAAAKALSAFTSFKREYTVTYAPNGGTTATTTDANTKASYSFANWNTEESGNGTSYADKASVSNLATSGTFDLYAQWNSASVTLPEATLANHVIEGWYKGSVDVPANKVGVPGDSYTPTENTTLTAKWIERYPFTMSGSDRTMNVDDEISDAFTFTYAENPTAHIEITSISSVKKGDAVIEYDAANNKLIARNAGVATIYFTQANTETILDGTSDTWTITVNKIANTLSVASETYTGKYVDDVIAGIISNKNSDAAVTTTSAITGMSNEDAAKVAYYKVSDNKIYMPNTDAVSFTSKTITINIAQAETYKYESVSKNITLTVNKYPTSFSGSAYNLMVDGTQTADYSWTNTSAAQPTASSNDDFYYTIDNVSFTNSAKNNGNNLVVFNPGNKLITACNAGTAKITLHQKETYKYTGATQSFNVAVYKYNSVFSGQATLNTTVEASPVTSGYVLTYTKPDNAYIGDANHTAGTPALNSGNWYYTLGHNITTANQVGCPNEYQDVVISYNAENKQATGRNQGAATVSLYQVETYKYNSASTSFNVNVAKNANALSCSWGSWSKDVNVDAQTGVTFSANNAQTPIVIEQTSGDDEGNVIATYSSANNKITSIYNLGEATWSVSQVENYKYVAAETKTLTVNVVKGSTECNFYEDASQHEIGDWGDEWEAVTWADNIVNEVSFQAAKNMGTAVGDLEVYIMINGNWQKYKSIAVGDLGGGLGSYNFGSDYFTYTIASNVRGIKFKNTGSYSRAIKNLSLKRRASMTLSTDEITMPTNTLGGNHTTATFTVNYNTCANQIKVVSNQPHITVNPSSISLSANGGNGSREITVTYACDDPETIDGVITVYTPYENKTINVHAATEKKSQQIEWTDLFADETVSLPQTFTSDNAASATSKMPITYLSGHSGIIEVAEDGLSFTIVGTGTTTLTAIQAGDDIWKSTSDTKTINATNKQVQRIIWNQQFTRSMSVGNEISLTARVTLLNIATGVETESLERTNEIVYSCPENNGVIEIVDGKKIRVLGYGNTTITASVAGNDDYEAATPVTLPVRVREIQTGDCDMPLVFEQNDEIEFFQSNLDAICGSPIAINHANGIPDKLSFDVRGAAWKLAIEYYGGSIQVQQSTNNKLSWSNALTTVSPAKGETQSSGEIQLDPSATHIRFIRPSGGRGYHYVGNIHITRLPFIQTENTIIDLGNVSVGEKRDFTIPVNYSSVKGNMNVTKLYSDNGLTIESSIEADCGDMDNYDLPATVVPQSVGPWTNTVTIRDPLSNMFLDVTINASIQKGDQVITWNPTLNILATEAPLLNAVASSGLTVSYAVTTDNNTVARIENGQVIILQPGTFAITASQNGNVNYNEAPNVVKEFTVTAETLTLLEGPTATDLTYGQTLSASTLTGGSVEDSKHNPVAGTFVWQVSSTAPNAGDNQSFEVVFVPSSNPTWYSTLQTTASLNVAQASPTGSQASLYADNIVYGQRLDEAVLHNHGSLDGTWTWANEDANKEIKPVGTYPGLNVHFKPSNPNYLEVDGTIIVTVVPAQPTGYSATASSIMVGQTVSNSTITNTGIAGEWEWVSPTASYSVANTYDVAAIFTPENTNYKPVETTLPLTVNPQNYTFTGSGSWDDSDNWNTHVVPTEPQDVIVAGNVIINDSVEVKSLTIEAGAEVTLAINGQLTVGSGNSEDRENYGNLHVEEGGHVILNNGTLKVNDFILDASLAGLTDVNNPLSNQAAKSGQVTNADKIDKHGQAYFDLSFDPSGSISYGWYDFTVPFEVNISGGISRINSTSNKIMVSGADFIIMEADEANRAAGGKGWRTLNGGVLQPGKLYTITLDDEVDQNTLRFTWNGQDNLMNGESYEVIYATGADANLNGWNGLGNGMLRHGYPDGSYKMQAYNHGTNTYDLVIGNKTFAVGSAFFIQVDAAGSVDWIPSAATSERPLYAPQREVRTVDEFLLTLTPTDTEYVVDALYVSASEDATTEYTIGHDLVKMGNPTESKVAKIWSPMGNLNLCDIELPLTNNNASFPLMFYAPQAGSYDLNIAESPEDATLFLTYDGRIIWNLSMSAYPLELQKGTTQGYGLRLVADRQTTTDFEQTGVTMQGVKKVLIDNQLYLIMPDGAIYTAEGKKVNE